MKVCSTCKIRKEDYEFYRDKRSIDNLASCCSSCARTARRHSYLLHKDSERRGKARRRNELLSRIERYMASHPCVDCGFSDTRALEFDHVRGKKSRDVTSMAHWGISWTTVLHEIAKWEGRWGNWH